jgi:hypothetical protein
LLRNKALQTFALAGTQGIEGIYIPWANAKGEPIRSWFRDGRFVPSVGIFGLFDGQAIPWKKGTEKAMLTSFKTSYKAGEFASYIKAVDKKREENTAKLAKARAKIKK